MDGVRRAVREGNGMEDEAFGVGVADLTDVADDSLRCDETAGVTEAGVALLRGVADFFGVSFGCADALDRFVRAAEDSMAVLATGLNADGAVGFAVLGVILLFGFVVVVAGGSFGFSMETVGF